MAEHGKASKKRDEENRRSLSGAFPGFSLRDEMERLNIDSHTTQSSSSKEKSASRKLSKSTWSIRGSWPKWFTISRSSKASIEQFIDFTLRIEPNVLDYSKPSMSMPQNAFNDAAQNIREVQELVKKIHNTPNETNLDETLADMMINAIYGSNEVERIRHKLDETIKLCREVFYGKLNDENVPPRKEYESRLEELVHGVKGTTVDQIRSRREIMQHAAAFRYITDAIVKRDEPFTEELIKRCHYILTKSIPIVGTNITSYSGKYRTPDQHVSAAHTNFVTPKFVPQAMARFVQELNEKLVEAEVEKKLDPFYLAAFACDAFVNIHPFLDGNGKVCRLILNSILMRYAGVVASIGEHDQERKEYMEIAKRSSDEATGPGELARPTLRKSMETLKQLRRKLQQ